MKLWHSSSRTICFANFSRTEAESSNDDKEEMREDGPNKSKMHANGKKTREKQWPMAFCLTESIFSRSLPYFVYLIIGKR